MSIMWDIIFLRFPHIADKILNQYLDQRSLANCRMVNVSWKNFLEKQKFYWIRMIKVYILFPRVYQRLFRLSSVENIRQYFHEVKDFYRNDMSEVGQTPIHFAAMTGQNHFVQNIIERIGAKVLLFRDQRGRTPLHFAAQHGQLPVCELIIANVENKNPMDREGHTPLYYAAKHGQMTVCQFIIENISDKNPLNPKDDYGCTLLHWAAEHGYLEVCQLIINYIEDKNPINSSRRTPLHYAASNGHLSICQLIMKNLTDPNPKGSHGCSPLHLAAENGHLPVCEYILDMVEEKNPQNQYGKTPYHYAKNNSHQTICDLICEKTGRTPEELAEPKREEIQIKIGVKPTGNRQKSGHNRQNPQYRKYRRLF